MSLAHPASPVTRFTHHDSTTGDALRAVARPDDLVEAAADILARRHQLPREDAVDLLEQAADDTRPLHEVAEDVVRLGLPLISTQVELSTESGPSPLRATGAPGGGPATAGTRTTGTTGTAGGGQATGATRAVSGIRATGATRAAGTTGTTRGPGAIPVAPRDEVPIPAGRPGQPSIRPLEVALIRLLEVLAETATLPQLLESVCALAVDLVDECDCAGLILLRDGAPATMAASDERARRIDEAQYRDAQGPYLEAMLKDGLVHVGDVQRRSTDLAWHRAAGDAGITAAVSLPIGTGADTVAILNLYTGRCARWPAPSMAEMQRFTGYAASAITLAHDLGSDDGAAAERHGTGPARRTRRASDPSARSRAKVAVRQG